MYEEKLKKFTRMYDELSLRYDNRKVFADFTKMCAISIYNAFMKNTKMEEEYLKIINSYEKEHQQIFPKMFAELVELYEEAGEITDILGPFYEKEKLSNGDIGQFFTPTHISDLLSKTILGEEKNIKSIIKEKGFITVNDPTCGAGGMILSFAKILKEQGINYQNELLVEVTDISEVCAYMTYIQLSLYGIPAIIYCGDTLTQKCYFKMETPFFLLNYWKFRKFYRKVGRNSEKTIEKDKQKIIINELIENKNLYKEIIVKSNHQISL